jgi:Zn-finger domain-containing protein
MSIALGTLIFIICVMFIIIVIMYNTDDKIRIRRQLKRYYADKYRQDLVKYINDYNSQYNDQYTGYYDDLNNNEKEEKN